MTRILFLSIIFALSLGLLAACGQGGENAEDIQETDGEEEPAVEEETTDEEDAPSNDDPVDEETTHSDTEEENVNQAAEENITETVTLYFSDDQLLETYKEEREVTAHSEDEIPVVALEAWIDGPVHEELVSHFNNEDIEVQSVKGENGIAEVSFSESFLDVNAGSSAELAITDQIALMMQQFGYEETKILIEGEEHPSLFGHLDATEPISAPNPNNYESIE